MAVRTAQKLEPDTDTDTDTGAFGATDLRQCPVSDLVPYARNARTHSDA